jgi:HlyD family secretion protein
VKRILIILGLLLVTVGAAFWAFDLPQRLGWRARGVDQLMLYGNIDIRQVELGFRVAGRIATMKFEEGETVSAGTVLAEIDTRPYLDKKQAADAQAAQKAATLQKLEAGPRPAEIAQARANLTERAADLENAQRAFERARQLRPGGVISQAALDDAQATKDMAVARLASTKESLNLLEEGSRVEDIAAARADFAAAQANAATAQTDLADTQLITQADGVILSRVREPGAIVAPNDIVYVLSLTRPVWVRAYIAEPQLGRIHPGMAVGVTSDSTQGHAYRAHIGFISPVAEFTPKSVETPELRTDLVYRLRVIVDDADERLRQGMPVSVQVALAPPAKGE